MIKNNDLTSPNTRATNLVNKPFSLKENYLNFCDIQMKNRVFWFLFPILFIPVMIMPFAIYIMWVLGFGTLFVGISVFSFFINFLVNITRCHTKISIPVFVATVFIHILAVLIALMIA